MRPLPAVVGRWGRIDILVNNAAFHGTRVPFLESAEAEWRRIFEVNVIAAAALARSAARHMLETGSGGAIVNVGSIQAAMPVATYAAYVASKGAVESLTRALAVELSAAGVRVNAVTPGVIATEAFQRTLSNSAAGASARPATARGPDGTAGRGGGGDRVPRLRRCFLHYRIGPCGRRRPASQPPSGSLRDRLRHLPEEEREFLMARISLKNVAKFYGDLQVLFDCNLEIADHEFVVLVGPSGSGKTTLLRLIAGLEHISGGDLFFDDTRMNDVDVGDRDIAMVFQNYGLYPHMSVYDNMAFGLKRRKIAPDEIDRRVRGAAEMLNMAPYLQRKPRQMSGGQRQRVALGRAIVREPAVFLLDEPLSNLDAHLRVQMRGEILRVHRAVTATAVYVTHDQVEALTMGDRIVVMNEGRIQQVGTPDELYDAPVNRFVASFIGTPAMGFLDCRVDGEAGDLTLSTETVRLRLDPAQARSVAATGAGRIDVGIRPERLTLGEDPAADWLVRGRVEVVEMLGSEQYVHFDVDGGSLTARVSRDHPIRVEDEVTFSGAAEHLHLFDPETGRTLS